jgi:hypothetical protein
MGILDDAIREHLELKKQHGASDEEVSKQEAEALGPARREAAFEPPPEPADEAILGHAETLPVEHHGEPVPAEAELHADPAVHPDPDAPVPGEQAQAAPPPPVHHEDDPDAPPPPVPGFQRDYSAPLDPIDLPESALPSDRRATQHLEAIQPGDQPPPPEPEPPAAEADGKEADVLEETPDFLQETPEHDRLWFEQKPPRDFDFDD